MSAQVRHIAYQFSVSLLTLWLVGTAVVIAALVVGIAMDSASADPTGLFRQH